MHIGGRRAQRTNPAYRWTYYRAIPPSGLSVSPGQAHTLLQSMATMGWEKRFLGWKRPLSFRFLVVKNKGASVIQLYFCVPSARLSQFQAAFTSSYPGVHLAPESGSPIVALPKSVVTRAKSIRIGERGLSQWLPLANEGVGGALDSLNAVLTTMGCSPAQAWVLDVWMRPMNEKSFRRKLWHKTGERKSGGGFSEFFSPSEILSEIIGKPIKSAPPSVPIVDEEWAHHRQLIRTRLAPNQRPFQVSIRLYAHGDLSLRGKWQEVLAGLELLRGENRLNTAWMNKRRVIRAMERGIPTRLMLWTSGELTSLVHLPDARQSSFPFVAANRGLVLPPSPASSGLRVGWSNFPGSEGKEIRIPFEQMAKHAFLAGATGSGKTTTLLQIMLGLVEQMKSDPEQSPGFTFFDPHGGAIKRLLSHIPPSLRAKVHVVPLGPTAYPRGLNLFRMDHQTDAEAITGEFVATLQELWPGSRPRSEHYLRNNVLTLLHRPPQTILGIAPLFLDPQFRKQLMPHLPPHLQQFWKGEFADIRNIGDHLGPIWNKLGALTTYPSLRRILGQTKSAVNTRKVMDDGDIVLIDGSGCTADAVKIIAGLYLIDLHFTCQRRPEHASRLHLFLADEVHLYATNVLQKILAEDRKFGLSLLLATQYLDQLPDPILAGILGNVGTLVLLQLGGPDADRLTRWLKPDISARDLLTIPELHALVRTKLDGGATQLFTMQNPIVTTGKEEWVRQALAYSNRHDGRPAAEIGRAHV